MSYFSGATSELRPYHFTYPERKLTMEEMLYKFIDEGKREHEEIRAFICEFQTTNELLFKERNNSLSELRFGVQELLKVINNTPMIDCKVKGVTTRGGKTTTQDAQNNDSNVHTEEPLAVNHDEPVESNEVRLEEAYMITMNERCSAVLVNKLPSKEKDPRSFTIPCDIGQLHINNALADLGASISLMPYTSVLKIGLGEPKATRMSLELADRSIKYPRGIKKRKTILATAINAMIEVSSKRITLRVGDDEVIFDVDQSIKRPPTEDDECYGIDDLDDKGRSTTEAQELLENEEPDSFISIGLEKSIDQSDLEGCERETAKPVKVEREHLYSASASEINEKKLELKDLPRHLEYAYLHAIAWKMSDIKGISPSYCTHKILIEDDFKPVIQPQRRLNPKVQDVVKNEIVKLLDSGLIYPISDSSWCMTRSLTNELYTPYKDPEREFRSSRRHFKTLSLDELRSPDFNLLSNEDYSKEE
ncbi:DNA-directed DNA polymerase [Tanacetum coccineum]